MPMQEKAEDVIAQERNTANVTEEIQDKYTAGL